MNRKKPDHVVKTQAHTVFASRHVNPAHHQVAATASFGGIAIIGSQMTFGPNEEIFGENEPAEYVYKVIKGTVRTYKSSATAGARSAPSACRAISSASKSATSTNFPPRPSMPRP